MLFRKKMTRSCAYCIHATKLDGDALLCVKKGVVSSQKRCMKFQYDPCKRIPPKPKAPDFSRFEDEDFIL